MKCFIHNPSRPVPPLMSNSLRFNDVIPIPKPLTSSYLFFIAFHPFTNLSRFIRSSPSFLPNQTNMLYSDIFLSFAYLFNCCPFLCALKYLHIHLSNSLLFEHPSEYFPFFLILIIQQIIPSRNVNEAREQLKRNQWEQQFDKRYRSDTTSILTLLI